MKIEDRDIFEALKGYGSYQEIRAWMDKRQQMTLRDEFASKAMQGIASALNQNHAIYWKEVAADAYAAADAMLAERNK